MKQLKDILMQKCAGRKVDAKALVEGNFERSGKQQRLSLSLQQGIDSTTSKKITSLVKNAKLKVQAKVQGDQVRITGKKKDALQTLMQMLRECDIEVPIQFKNFRD